MGATSFFSDFGHEMATAILPAFLISVGGSAALLGIIEGIADGGISLMKLLAGWASDRVGKRKPFAVFGYFLTAIGVGALGFTFSWPQILLARLTAWLGRGAREPARDALLTDSTEPRFYGRVFGFHRGMDTLGAVVGPAVAFLLIKFLPLRNIFFIALIPSLLAFLTVLFLVKDHQRTPIDKPLLGSVQSLPSSFRLFLVAVGIFGLGNFADSMLILRATQLLSPIQGAVIAGSLAILLYTLHNIFYAVLSFPIGVLADRLGKMGILASGYILTGLAALGFILQSVNIFYLGLLFILAGLAIAITDSLERSVAADLLPTDLRGTGFGTLATVNGIGDFASSSVVGLLWVAVSPLVGFGYAASLCVCGGFMLLSTQRK